MDHTGRKYYPWTISEEKLHHLNDVIGGYISTNEIFPDWSP